MNLHEEIAKVAYELYLKRGCVHGHDLSDWLEAERIVLARHAGQEIEEPDIEEPDIEVTEEIPSITKEELAEETVIEETEAPPVVEKKRVMRKKAKKAEEKPKKKVTRKKKKE